MDYSQLSDFEINKRVAEIAINGDWLLEPTDESPSWFFNHGVQGKNTVKLPDYCNNPADAWPIIVDNEISLNSYGSAWEASFEHDAPIGAFGTDETVTSGYEHRNPLRAAMIAFLMKQEQANA
ncbi:phage protein NinX family protein [Enterobacter cloacae]|uniref:DUF2591 domain-containing protein n=1 Tax=Enterobacter cloacae subsp. cloacae (strain ATCC 13047 / DSM 30054 / NBRC 13535 / NCTC 10005 / WDCM 00083 / NCDC 279-56) TaxID=716541 RepID=A0A0H3CP75_ENTCC|nr:phage protein NinX family protein [Enterobacter cloacae]HAS0821256.1 DUF2591 domain-containing protein [Enterobacter cloacae subsp. cloacae]ADF63110.1 hypothetical protein ECL_03576 [Enterobacter cloacae subsp. cloacae ATCC 13047]KGB13251.1 hypothetical protein DR74_4917 [Enterobacter cloacae]OOC83292.1 hypothetical protein BWP06_20135 [Enterobacter cloacae]QLA63918.1 DUF2591 family protein [Enterobacter cloacae]